MHAPFCGNFALRRRPWSACLFFLEKRTKSDISSKMRRHKKAGFIRSSRIFPRISSNGRLRRRPSPRNHGRPDGVPLSSSHLLSLLLASSEKRWASDGGFLWNLEQSVCRESRVTTGVVRHPVLDLPPPIACALGLWPDPSGDAHSNSRAPASCCSYSDRLNTAQAAVGACLGSGRAKFECRLYPVRPRGLGW